MKGAVTAGNVDLVKYAAGLSDKDVAGGTDLTISNKKIDNAVKMINGLPCIKITYNYVHVIVGANVTETGKVVLYLIKTKGTSLIHTEEHEIIIRLKFDEQQVSGDSIDKLATAIGNTIEAEKE